MLYYIHSRKQQTALFVEAVHAINSLQRGDIMAINVDSVTPNILDNPVRNSATIDRPADTRTKVESKDTDKENLERADERRLQETQQAKEERSPTRSQDGNVIGTIINTVA